MVCSEWSRQGSMLGEEVDGERSEGIRNWRVVREARVRNRGEGGSVCQSRGNKEVIEDSAVRAGWRSVRRVRVRVCKEESGVEGVEGGGKGG